MSTTQISTVSGITLVTLQGSPATTAFMADVFERIAKLNVNIDMISMPPNHGANAGLSFTISDQDLIDVLSLVNSLKTETGIKVIVSSVNHKISVYDPQMKNTPGMAARVFSAIASSDADIRLITTSEVEISFLVTEADYDTVLKAIETRSTRQNKEAEGFGAAAERSRALIFFWCRFVKHFVQREIQRRQQVFLWERARPRGA